MAKDSLIIPPLQDQSTTCVSANLAYSQLWLNDWPIEKYDSVKRAIEENFQKTYNKDMRGKGVANSVIQEFIQVHSGINAMPISLDELMNKMKDGYTGLGTLIIRNQVGDTWGHEISIIGYDCNDYFVCKDSEKMELVTYSKEKLSTFNIAIGQNSIFYIEQNF